MLRKNILIYSLLILSIFLPFSFVQASTVLSSHKYAWSNNIGYINFENLIVSSTALSGYAWAENSGWINFSPAEGGVSNNDAGNLSGSAWGEQLGWIDFDGVSINPSTGQFSGTATGTLVGTINFDCPNYCDVVTDWRPSVVTPISSVGGNGGGGRPITQNQNTNFGGGVVDLVLPIPKKLQDSKNLGVYWFNETNQQWVLIPDAKFNKTEAIFKFYPNVKFNIFELNFSKSKTNKKIIVPSLPVDSKSALGKKNKEIIQKYEVGSIQPTEQVPKSFFRKILDFISSVFSGLFKGI